MSLPFSIVGIDLKMVMIHSAANPNTRTIAITFSIGQLPRLVRVFVGQLLVAQDATLRLTNVVDNKRDDALKKSAARSCPGNISHHLNNSSIFR